MNFYFTVLSLLKNGKTTSHISKELNVSKQKIYYYTRILRELGFLEKKGYGVWEVKRSKKEDLEHALNWKAKKIRGHAFIWKVKSKSFNWEELLKKKKIKYNLVRGYTPRIIINNMKVWLAKDSIIIYDSRSFYGRNAFESRKYAVFGVKSILDTLQSKLGVSLGKYLFKPVREHFGMIKNELARQCNEKGEKIIVRDDLDGEWFWIDDSTGMNGEMETGGKGITKDRASVNVGVQRWWNDMKSTNFKVTPSFLMESIGQVTSNQLMFNQNFESHVSSIKQLGNSAEANSRTTELLAEVVLNLSKRVEELTREVSKRNGNKKS